MPYSVKHYEELYSLVQQPDQQSMEALVANRTLCGNDISGYRLVTYKSGDMVECEMFPIWKTHPGGVRCTKGKPSRKAQVNLNARNSQKHLIRLINTNFKKRDIWLTVCYDDEHRPATIEGANQIMSNYVARLRRECVKRGWPALKYIFVTETGGENGRVHHHMITNFPDRDLAERKWNHGGRTQSRRLQPDDFGLEGMARYLSKDPKGKKRYVPSRNLTPPEVTFSDTKLSRRKVERLAADEHLTEEVFTKLYTKYKGSSYKFLDSRVSYSNFVDGCYLYVRMRRTEQRRKGECT